MSDPDPCKRLQWLSHDTIEPFSSGAGMSGTGSEPDMHQALCPNSTLSQGHSQEGVEERGTAKIPRGLLSSHVFNPQDFSLGCQIRGP